MNGEWRLHYPPRSPLDELVNQLERKWGIDRLPHLVSPETAAKFGQAVDMHSAAQDTGQDMAPLNAMMERAWRALDAEATSLGKEPLPPGLFEIQPDEPERGILVVCLDDQHAQAVQLRAKAEGRVVETWTRAAVARALKAMSVVSAAGAAFPGMQVSTGLPERPSGRVALPDDPIPFGALGAVEPEEQDA